MNKIVIILDGDKGHVERVFTCDQDLVVEVVDIDRQAQDPVIGPYTPGVTTLVRDVDAAAAAYIQAQVPGYHPEQEEC